MLFEASGLSTHASAFGLMLLFAAMLATAVFFFTRRRILYYQVVGSLFLIMASLYWFAVRPAVESARATPADRVFEEADSKHKTLDRAGRFGRSGDLTQTVPAKVD
jgi:hypothetical protein